MGKANCKKCGKEVDKRGLQMHEARCKGNQAPPAQTEAQPSVQGSGVKSAIVTKKAAPKTPPPAETNTPQPKRKSIWDEIDSIFD